ncbi:hypothetical protein [Nesterenkonia alkaliphila]|uniref:Uncharacterized protein n=1 Tax=Nesterenkonia alkaliphila TaxID=1463631 RepID=A0A7K1UM16_9MICC|nr:hypothetical protein [Nesterenkonia alkaliphila]MVT27466.1 hypothetical protein [Nesterenkonia alkaliphila]GFZ89453.1 hypothetical protein GCM10011359_18550 [Nesterenkonia alkaliphila]
MSQNLDAQVIQSALGAHLGYLRAAESAHRAAGRALASHPQLPELVRSRTSPIAVSAAHRARSASFGQRAEFVEQLLNFPAAGLRALTEGDMRTLQVPAHIGQAALPKQVADTIAERETRARLAAARPVSRPATGKNPVVSAAEPQPAPWHKRSFDDILLGRK